MNDLEDRLRAALVARAADFTASPDAWERTTARARRPLRRLTSRKPGRRGLARFTPLAAAAAVVAVAITTATLASTGGWHDLVYGQPATSTATVKPPWYWLPGAPNTPIRERGRIRSWLRVRPMCGRLIGPVISFDQATVWYSWGTGPYKDLYLCDSTASGSLAGPAGRGTPANTEGWAPDGISGDAVLSVTSVTAVLADGHRVAGQVWRGGGLPYGLWEVDYPSTDSAVIVFRNAAGQVVTQLNQSALNQSASKPVNALAHPASLTLTNIGDCANSGWSTQPVRVPQTMDGYKTWTYIQYGKSAVNGPTLCEFAGLPHRSTSFSTSFRATATLIFRDAAGQVVATLHGQNGNWPVD